jgi:DNA-binding LytR/AlgR family response regulator
MIRTLIIEDEGAAAERLEKLLIEIDPNIQITGKIDSVSGAVNWLSNNLHPELLMLDIQLADGLSFEIFNHVKVDSFVIFTTAYDEYAIKAFELNSLDYLLKPIDKIKLKNSIEKFKKFKSTTPALQLEQLLASMASKTTNYKKRFAISIGTKIRSIETKQIAFFNSIEKNSFLHTF